MTANYDREAEMAAFDMLPRRLRDFFNNHHLGFAEFSIVLRDLRSNSEDEMLRYYREQVGSPIILTRRRGY